MLYLIGFCKYSPTTPEGYSKLSKVMEERVVVVISQYLDAHPDKIIIPLMDSLEDRIESFEDFFVHSFTGILAYWRLLTARLIKPAAYVRFVHQWLQVLLSK